MSIEIDQSWKVEHTGKASYFGLSNEFSFVLKVPAKVKRAGFRYLEEKYKRSRMNIIRIFSATVVILLKMSASSEKQIWIDVEYEGYESVIANMIVSLAAKAGIILYHEQIMFKQVTKKSEAHKIAIDAFRNKKKPRFRLKEPRITLTTVMYSRVGNHSATDSILTFS